MKNGWLITTSLTIDNSRILDVLCIGRKYWYTTLLPRFGCILCSVMQKVIYANV